MILSEVEHLHGTSGPPLAGTYSPEILPLIQSLLRTLADIDFAFEKDLETVANSEADETMKRQVVERLKQRHEERRAPYLREVAALQRQIQRQVETDFA